MRPRIVIFGAAAAVAIATAWLALPGEHGMQPAGRAASLVARAGSGPGAHVADARIAAGDVPAVTGDWRADFNRCIEEDQRRIHRHANGTLVANNLQGFRARRSPSRRAGASREDAGGDRAARRSRAGAPAAGTRAAWTRLGDALAPEFRRGLPPVPALRRSLETGGVRDAGGSDPRVAACDGGAGRGAAVVPCARLAAGGVRVAAG